VIREKFAGTPVEKVAIELAAQIPLRGDDFKTLKLPDAKEWAALQKTRTRTQQIAYLRDRLRILNCFQEGQPGGVDLRREQYAEACGLSDDAAWGQNKGKTELINPLVELDKLKLTIDDVPALTPGLKSDWFILAVGFWRDFNEERHILHTRPLLCELIDKLAGRDICREEELEDPAKQAASIDAIDQYAISHHGMSEADLLLSTLENGIGDHSSWFDMRLKAWRLRELHERRAAPIMLKYLERSADDEYEVEEILQSARECDASALKAIAPHYLNHKRLAVRMQAALSLLGTDQDGQAQRTLADVLSKADYSNFSGSDFKLAVSLLLDQKTAEGRKTAVHAFDGPTLGKVWPEERIAVIKSFANAGMPDGFRYYLKLMGEQDEASSHRIADEILRSYDENDPELKRLSVSTEGKPDEAAAAVRQWLQAKRKSMDAATRP
jgi:hypothetical protein